VNPDTWNTPLIDGTVWRNWVQATQAIIDHPNFAADVLTQKKTCEDRDFCDHVYFTAADKNTVAQMKLLIKAA